MVMQTLLFKLNQLFAESMQYVSYFCLLLMILLLQNLRTKLLRHMETD